MLEGLSLPSLSRGRSGPLGQVLGPASEVVRHPQAVVKTITDYQLLSAGILSRQKVNRKEKCSRKGGFFRDGPGSIVQ